MTDSQPNQPAGTPVSSQQPPPLPPAGQFAPPPPIAGAPPVGGGPLPVLPVMPYGGYAPYWGPPPGPPENPRAKTLILWSRILGWGGLAVLFVGSLVGGVAMSGPGGDPTLLIVCVVVGFGAAVIGAILGQIGRAMQGRVV